jgi:CspA family cold shock protein
VRYGQFEQWTKREERMTTGTVKWFNDSKGYGFLTQDGGGPDVFVHYSAIDGGGFKTLQQGTKVTYEIVQTEKGLQAKQVKVEG